MELSLGADFDLSRGGLKLADPLIKCFFRTGICEFIPVEGEGCFLWKIETVDERDDRFDPDSQDDDLSENDAEETGMEIPDEEEEQEDADDREEFVEQIDFWLLLL